MSSNWDFDRCLFSVGKVYWWFHSSTLQLFNSSTLIKNCSLVCRMDIIHVIKCVMSSTTIFYKSVVLVRISSSQHLWVWNPRKRDDPSCFAHTLERKGNFRKVQVFVFANCLTCYVLFGLPAKSKLQFFLSVIWPCARKYSCRFQSA